jgi:hypothetical protein
MTEKREVMRARVALWKVARRCKVGGVEGDVLGAESGRQRVVVSFAETSRMRMFVRAWSFV